MYKNRQHIVACFYFRNIGNPVYFIQIDSRFTPPLKLWWHAVAEMTHPLS